MTPHVCKPSGTAAKYFSKQMDLPETSYKERHYEIRVGAATRDQCRRTESLIGNGIPMGFRYKYGN